MQAKFAIPLCSTVLTALVLLILQKVWSLPLWPVFIAWACFFHLGGGERPRAAMKQLLACLLFGVLMAWMGALAILMHPLANVLPDFWFGPLLIGLSIGVIVVAANWSPLAVTPACIYGFAAVWAFLDVPGRFDVGTLTSLSAANVIIAVPCGFVFGCLCGYLNSGCVQLLVSKQTIVHEPVAPVA